MGIIHQLRKRKELQIEGKSLWIVMRKVPKEIPWGKLPIKRRNPAIVKATTAQEKWKSNNHLHKKPPFFSTSKRNQRTLSQQRLIH